VLTEVLMKPIPSGVILRFAVVLALWVAVPGCSYPVPEAAASLVSGSEGNDSELARKVDDYLDRAVAADEFSGAVLVAREGNVLYRKAFGLASRSFGKPNEVSTKFNLGSMNKMFTAVAISQLAQRGKLSFGDVVGTHLPDWPNARVRNEVTLHQLLTHTSGMGSYFNDTYERSAKERFRKVQDYRPLYADEALQFDPGSRWSYSNSGFMLLGEIVETVSGEDYFDYVHEHVTGPLEMNDTACYELDHDTPNLAIGYTKEGPHPLPAGEKWNNLFLHVVKGGPAGGCFSTVEDLVKFGEGLRHFRLLDEAFTETLTRGKVVPDSARPDRKYAYGIGDETVGTERIVGHSGGFPGINGRLDIYWSTGYVVAVLANYDPPAAERVAEEIRGLLLPS
jgi:CubicO group peptidase (beta-lactamase class C family)